MQKYHQDEPPWMVALSNRPQHRMKIACSLEFGSFLFGRSFIFGCSRLHPYYDGFFETGTDWSLSSYRKCRLRRAPQARSVDTTRGYLSGEGAWQHIISFCMDRTMFYPYRYILVSEKPGYRLIAIFKVNRHGWSLSRTIHHQAWK